MVDVPDDIMKAANEAMSGWWLSLEGHETFGTRVPQYLTTCIAKAINAERLRWTDEVEHLKAFRSFTIANTDIRDCPVCSGPRLGAYVCTHCGDDE